MLTSYRLQSSGLKGSTVSELGKIPADAIWLDLFEPTEAERGAVSALLRLDLPSRADMEEIEASSRLHQRDGGTFMTITTLANLDDNEPVVDAITFVLVRATLVTLRYIDPPAFHTFAARSSRGAVVVTEAEDALTALLDAIVDGMADDVEAAGSDIEAVSRHIFGLNADESARDRDFQAILRRLGRLNDVTSKMRASLLTVYRMLGFLTTTNDSRDVRDHVRTLLRDVQSLQDHVSHLADRLTYLLDATLGLINIDQNNIIKIISVAAMIFVPPTLIASLVAMNLKLDDIPEAAWVVGAPVSLLLMIASAVVPYLWFKRRGWL